eukprot:9001624-Heterocapsa_arctica.AAC.1
MPVLVEHDQIGPVCNKFRTIEDFQKNVEKCCVAGKKSNCLMCKAVIESKNKEQWKCGRSDITGIEKFIADQKEKKAWKEATNNQKLIQICSALSEMKDERHYVSGFGAVRLSKKEAMDVAD